MTPVAQLKVSQAGRTVTVDASGSTDADGNTLSFEWDFGDGTTASGPTATHTYAADGSYLIGLMVADNAGAKGFAWSAVTITGDTAGPVITWLGDIDDLAVFEFGQVPAAPTCTATDDGFGINSDGCVVTGYATNVGAHKLTATATDNAGNTTTETRTFTVSPWTLRGFSRPVSDGGTWNRVKGGSTVPLKFQVFRGDVELADTAIVRDVAVQRTTCDAARATLGGPVTLSGLRYAEGEYHLNWKTCPWPP